MVESGLAFASDVLNALAAQIAVLDRHGAIVVVNEAWMRFSRENGGPADASAYVGSNYLAASRPAVLAGDAEARAACEGIDEVLRGIRSEFSCQYPCHAPRKKRWFRMSVTRFGDREGLHLVVSHEDVTVEVVKSRELEDAERLLRSVLETLPVGVWILDGDGTIRHANPAAGRIWGGIRRVGPEQYGEYRGWWADTGAPIAPADWGAARAIREGETSLDEEIEIEGFDGVRRVILHSSVPLRDSAGRITGALVVNQDISIRKRAEREREALLQEQDRLRRAALDANRAKDDFIATLSHELRTPLQSVLGWVAVLRGAPADPALTARVADAIERNARLQVQLLEDTLDLSRIVHGRLTMENADVNLPALVAGVVEALRPAAEERQIAFVEAGGETQAIVRGDATRLQQVVWNLLTNALKFTPAGGRIDVRTEVGPDAVTVSIRDTGIGIAPDFVPLLFDRFSQGGDTARRRLGIGLGLSIVKELVERHRGTVQAESEGEGRGATFTVRLPLARAREADLPEG